MVLSRFKFICLSLVALIILGACERIPEWELKEKRMDQSNLLLRLRQVKRWMWTCRGQQVSFRLGSENALVGKQVDEFFDYFRSSELSSVDPAGAKTILGTALMWDGRGYLLTLKSWVDQSKDWECSNGQFGYLPASLAGTDRPMNLAVLKVELGEYADSFRKSQRWRARNDFPDFGEKIIALSSSYPGLMDQMPIHLQPMRPNLHTGMDSALILFQPRLPEMMMGGILVDEATQVIGYVFPSQQAGWGMAMTTEHLTKLVNAIIRSGKVERAYLGMRVRHIRGEGFIVQEVAVGGPAYKAGIRAQDMILKWEGKELNELQDWPDISFEEIGKNFVVTYSRDDTEVETRIQVSSAN